LQKKQIIDSQTDALVFGRCLHSMFLQPDLNDQIKRFDGTKNVSKTWLKAKEASDDYMLVPYAQYDMAVEMCKSLRANEEMCNIFSGGNAEIVLLGDLENKYKAKAKLDYLKEGEHGVIIGDLKTIADIEFDKMQWTIIKYGYHIQAAWYKLLTEFAGYTVDKFIFGFVSKKEPYNTICIELSDEFMAFGLEMVNKHYKTYKDCLANNTWPAPYKGTYTIELPRKFQQKDDY